MLLKSSIESGVNAGISVALGIVISDVVCLYLCSYFAPYFQDPTTLKVAAFIGAAVLIFIGVSYIKTKPKVQSKKRFTNQSFVSFFGKGFLINFVNPFVFVVWLGFVIYGEENFSIQHNRVSFFMGILFTIFATDVIKVLLAQPIKKVLSIKTLTKTYKIIGVLLLLFSLRLIAYVLFE